MIEQWNVMHYPEKGSDLSYDWLYRYYRLKTKINQDRCLCYYDEKTQSLIAGVFDGHGENGHVISEVLFILCL